MYIQLNYENVSMYAMIDVPCDDAQIDGVQCSPSLSGPVLSIGAQEAFEIFKRVNEDRMTSEKKKELLQPTINSSISSLIFSYHGYFSFLLF